MSPEEKQKIVNALQVRGAVNPCPRCGNPTFSLIDGYFYQSLQPKIGGNVVIGGPAVPSVVIVCNRCGFMSQHSLGVLGLLPPKSNEQGEAGSNND